MCRIILHMFANNYGINYGIIIIIYNAVKLYINYTLFILIK